MHSLTKLMLFIMLVSLLYPSLTVGMDFINTTATVTFPVAAAANLAQSPTNSTPITIKINNDSVPEEEECFTCSITNYTTPCNVRLGSITKTKICIPDDDVQGAKLTLNNIYSVQ